MRPQPIDVGKFVSETKSIITSAIAHAERATILYHADVDGLCAAATLQEFISLNSSAQVQSEWIPTSEFHFRNFTKRFPNKHQTQYLSVDINFTSREGFLKNLNDIYGNNLIIIDDHFVNNNELEHLSFINPNNKSHQYRELASSLYCYELLTCISKNVPNWVALLGLYFDRQINIYEHLFDQSYNRKQFDYAIRLLSVEFLDENCNRVDGYSLKFLRSSIKKSLSWDQFYQILDGDDFLYDKLCQNESEISKCVSLAKAKSRRIISKNGNILIITDFQSSLQIANIVSSQLRGSHKNGIYLAIRRGDVNSQFEVRLGHRVEGVDLVALITEISKEVDLLNHGGHMRAAGGGLLSVNLEMFIDSAIRILAE